MYRKQSGTEGPSGPYKHPVLQALGTLDRSADNYQERRVKIINKYTHTIDPVIDVVRTTRESLRKKFFFYPLL